LFTETGRSREDKTSARIRAEEKAFVGKTKQVKGRGGGKKAIAECRIGTAGIILCNVYLIV
jgi:hypothetical protein